jgi:hypothetical protein
MDEKEVAGEYDREPVHDHIESHDPLEKDVEESIPQIKVSEEWEVMVGRKYTSWGPETNGWEKGDKEQEQNNFDPILPIWIQSETEYYII